MARPPGVLAFGDYLAEVATTTRRLLGADRVDLRTFERLPASEAHVLGAALTGYGHMLVGPEVPEFIEDLLASRERGLGLVDGDLERLRLTVSTLVHECIHLALPHDFDPDDVVRPLRPELVFLEEGVTEATTQAVLPDVLAGQESMFPGISRSVPDSSGYYPNYVPAARDLVSLVQALPEMQGRVALLELACVGPDRKFDLLVEQAMEGFGLTFNVAARDRESVRSRIRTALEAQLQRNYHWMVPPDQRRPDMLNTREPEALSTIMGKQMGMELLRQLHAEGERVEMDVGEGWRQRLAVDELSLAKGFVGAVGFTGTEARGAAASWVATASQRRADIGCTDRVEHPPIVRADRWLRSPRGHHLRASQLRCEHADRGVAR